VAGKGRGGVTAAPTKSKGKERNDARTCGKANKQNPGVSPNANSGKSRGGYSIAKHPAKAARATAEYLKAKADRRKAARAARRSAAQAAPAKRARRDNGR
jgi:hypothetical protein